MASRNDAAKALRQELDRLQELRHDEKAWKAQHKNVEKATASWDAARRKK